MDELGRRLDKMMLDAIVGSATTSTITEPDRPFCMADLQWAMIQMAHMKPAPPNVKIVESVHMVDRHEDWSKVRSPSRTLRRMRHNAKRIYTYTPKKEALHLPDGSLVMHPVTAAHLTW